MKPLLQFKKIIVTLCLIIFFIPKINAQSTDIKFRLEENKWKTQSTAIPNDKDLIVIFELDNVNDYTYQYYDTTVSKWKTVDQIIRTSGSNNFKITKEILGQQSPNLRLSVQKDQSLIANEITIDITKVSPQPDNNNNNTSTEISGYAFQDALLLQKSVEKNDGKMILDILSSYKKVTINELNLSTEFKDNNFILNYFESKKIVSKGIITSQSGSNLSESIIKNASSIGGLDVTKIADGFAKFIVKRTKEELSIAFFEKFKKELDSIPSIQTVFPQTYKSLNVIDKDIYMFKAYIQTLREAFEFDLSNLPENLPTIIDNNPDFFDKHLELKASLLSSFYLADQIKNGTNPGIIIEDFPDEEWADASINKNYRATFKTIKLFSKSFRNSNGENTYWVDYSEIKKLFQNDDLLKLYLGLLVEQARLDNIIFQKKDNGDEKLYKIINDAANLQKSIDSYRIFVKEIAQKTQSIDLKIKELPSIKNDSLKFEKYYSIISNTLDLMRKTVKIKTLPHFPILNINIKDDSNRYFDMAQTAADAAIDVNRRNYTSAIVNIAELYNLSSEIYGKDDKNLKKLSDDLEAKTKTVNSLINNKDKKSEFIQAKKELLDSQLKVDEYIDANYKSKYAAFFKYGTFMATVTQAKNSQQVEEAIEAFALPTGSARIKRETMFNVALNAYCGLFYGGEKIKGLDNCYKGTYGVTAPIGISISYGKQKVLPLSSLKKYKGHWSHTVFLSIIDLGAITAFRFQDDVTESAPKIELKDIISPGIFYSFGIPKSPLSVNLGYQVGPLLRKVTAAENTYSNSYSRLSIAFVVDIPILNFYTKSK